MRGDGSTPGGIVTNAQSQQSENAGFMMQMERRTGSSSLSVGVPLGVSNVQGATLGQIQAGYYTARYGLQYMPQPVSILGGVPMGSTLPGFSLVLPLHGGDVSLYQGRSLIDLNSGARVYGVRGRVLAGRNLFELGLVRARRDDAQATVDSLIGGFASDNGDLNQLFEGALQRRHDVFGTHGVSALQYRLDYGSDTVYSTITAKHVGSGFTSIGSGQILADNQISGAFHTGPVDVQETFDRAGTGDQMTRSRQGSLSFFHQFGNRRPLSTMWNVSDQQTRTADSTLWLGTAGVQFAMSFGDLSTLFQVQGSRSTSSSAPPVAGVTYQALIQKPFGDYTVNAQIQKSRQIGAATFNDVGQTLLNVSRQWGPTAITLADTFTHTTTMTSNAYQTAPLLTLSRRLSPVLALAVSYGIQTTRDTLNPSSNGRSRLFDVQLTAPFSIGNGLVQGHANPRLPATISGMVINDIGDQGAFAAAVSNGVGNVMVVLDGAQVQRTDLSGRFQFNFVTPGHHTVQLELGSLPRGVTPDQPVAALDVQGGQQGSVVFRIGNYGAIQGHVFGRDTTGEAVPLAGVVLTLDNGAQLSTTGADGLYGFGRLAAGSHVVAVETASLPAMASLSSEMTTQKINVRTGQISTLDFTAKPLGSIGGFVVFDQSLAPDHKGGVLNAYVVAEPGDYAAITDEDGSFLLDNLPAGTYTLDLDPETVPKDTGNISGPQTITLDPGAQVQAVRILVGTAQKNVVFTLKAVGPAPPSASLEESRLPPGGATEVTFDADSAAKAVTASAFGKQYVLAYDGSRKKWVGTIVVPLSANPGTGTVDLSARGAHAASTSLEIAVDPKIPLATFVITPRHPMHGQYVSVRARFLADVHPGDKIHWLDGQITQLSRPVTGRVYEFTVKISEQPLRGLLLTRQGELPITLR
ncbi:MAG TPA: carboxypeptidase regulatory-like domain-containing protein [Candidatus Baltobacteraceae bacterium]